MPRVMRAPDFYSEPGAWLSFMVAQAKRCPEPPVLMPTEDAALLVAAVDQRHRAAQPIATRLEHSRKPAMKLRGARGLQRAPQACDEALLRDAVVRPGELDDLGAQAAAMQQSAHDRHAGHFF